MELREYKCKKCGGRASFDIGKQKLICNYCKTQYEPGELEEFDPDDYEASGEFRTHEMDYSPDESQDLRLYICQSCGGQIILDESTATSSCPYCNNNIFIPASLSGDYRPDFVLPFKYDKDFAKDQLVKFYKNKKLLPDSFRDENQLDLIKGLYVPFWLYSGMGHVNLRARASRLSFWSDGSYNYTRTSYYDVRREGRLEFKYVPVDGSSKIENILMESLEPFYWEEGVEFSVSYLAGFLTDRYDMKADSTQDIARKRIENSSLKTIRDQLGDYDTVQVQDQAFELEDGLVNYALAPVWVLNTRWKGKFYTFLVNGQTGKMIGDDLPIDRGKAIRSFVLAFVLVSLVSMGLLYLVFSRI